MFILEQIAETSAYICVIQHWSCFKIPNTSMVKSTNMSIVYTYFSFLLDRFPDFYFHLFLLFLGRFGASCLDFWSLHDSNNCSGIFRFVLIYSGKALLLTSQNSFTAQTAINKNYCLTLPFLIFPPLALPFSVSS